MKERHLSEEEKDWLRENYYTKTSRECAKYLLASKSLLAKWVKELGLRKRFNAPEVKDKIYCKAVVEYGKGYCIDCKHYVVGGTCGDTGRITGALHKKSCFKSKD